ncbi:multiple epidermal growth factor-like domains protein 11, partial [Gigantopelta aegis]|uniref:multiple epidermal growth factor-like domains protein 11 n=1 Tax=Gigantopelta aegis TaxID=1735272 RepID=UPI001B88CA1E
MSTWLTTVFLCVMWTSIKTDTASGVCPEGHYGLDCSYTCHCTSGCDSVTGCSGGCTKGWSGPKCTIENVALNKTAYQSGYHPTVVHPPSYAVDGNTDQGSYGSLCIVTPSLEPYTWWEVDLGRPYYIHQLAVHFRTDYVAPRNDVHVFSSLKMNQTNTSHLCGVTTLNSSDVTYITCNDTAQYITLFQGTNNDDVDVEHYNPGKRMDICEVEVFICDAGTFGDNCTEFCHCQGQPCNYTTGECVGGCKQNWTGTQCD